MIPFTVNEIRPGSGPIKHRRDSRRFPASHHSWAVPRRVPRQEGYLRRHDGLFPVQISKADSAGSPVTRHPSGEYTSSKVVSRADLGRPTVACHPERRGAWQRIVTIMDDVQAAPCPWGMWPIYVALGGVRLVHPKKPGRGADLGPSQLNALIRAGSLARPPLAPDCPSRCATHDVHGSAEESARSPCPPRFLDAAIRRFAAASRQEMSL